MDLLFLIFSVWFGVWLFRNVLTTTTEDDDIPDEDMEINLFLETIDQKGFATYLAYREDNSNFVCQAPTEKELHTKLFEIFRGAGINMRVGEDQLMKIRFEVFEKPVNQ